MASKSKLLPLNAVMDQAFDIRFGNAFVSECIAETQFGAAKETHLDLSVGGDAESIAGTTKMIGHARYESDASQSPVLDAPPFGGIVGTIVHSLQCEFTL